VALRAVAVVFATCDDKGGAIPIYFVTLEPVLWIELGGGQVLVAGRSVHWTLHIVMGVPAVCEKSITQGLGDEQHQGKEYPWLVPHSMHHGAELDYIQNRFHPGVVK
jgi:hypothetical protein